MAFFTGLRGLISALATSLIVLGALSLSLAEGMVLTAPTAQPEPTLPPVNLTPLPDPDGRSLTQTAASQIPTNTIPVLVTPTEDLSSFCERPSGWEVYVIQPGDTLESLSAERNIPLEQLMAGNCLVSPQVIHGTFLYLPIPTPTPTVTMTKTATTTVTAAVTRSATATRTSTTPGKIIPSPVPCGPYPGWVRYRIQKGDTLFSLSRELNTSVSQLQHANCLGSSTLIRAGHWLWVPRLPYRTPTPTYTMTQPPATPTGTKSPVPTSTATSTVTPTATLTATPTPTNTETATLTPTPTETETEEPGGEDPPPGES